MCSTAITRRAARWRSLCKDLGIIQDMARSQRFPVPVAAAALQMFLMTAASGMGRDDDASVARMYARVTGTHLPGEP